MKVDESNFISQIKMRNPKALDFTVDKYGHLVSKIAYNVLNSGFYSNYVEECVNDVFGSIWNNIDSFDEKKGNFKCWIATITKYKAIDYKRKLFKHSISENIEEVVDYHPLAGEQSEHSAEDIAIMNENKMELIKMIKSMKSEDTEIFIRRYFLQEAIEDIAKLLGLNRNVVDKKLSRGRKYLKEKMLSWKGEMLG